MSSLLIRQARLLNPGKSIETGDALIRDGKIVALGRIESGEADLETIDGGGRLLTPGLIDVHTHGICHSLYDQGTDSLCTAAGELPRFGVTTILPTIIPRPADDLMERLAALAAAVPAITEVNIPGFHLEGPFMALGGAACPTLPGDPVLLEQLLAACAGRVAAMSISPDTKDILPIIRTLRERSITVFITHTRADVDQTQAALEAGARHATHFYDVFYAPAETDPGVRPVGAVETILADPRATVDFIADGIHVHPMAIKAAIAAKTWAGVVLITDSNIGAGLPAGIYDTPWGFRVKVAPDQAARNEHTGGLAGSSLTMNRGIANLLAWLDLPPEQVWAMGTLNPARVMGLTAKGRLEPGADADLVLWNDDLTATRTWVNGRLVYEA